MNPSQNTPAERPGWEPCPRGTIREASRNSVMSRRSVIVKCAALVSVVVGGMAVRNVWLPRQEAPTVGVGRLGCEQVANRLDCYISGNIDCCDQIKAIEAHLAVCRSCSQLHLIKLGNLATAKRDI